MAYQVPDETKRAALLARYEQKGEKAFLNVKVSENYEVSSATVYVSTDTTPDHFKAAAWYILAAISPQLDYQQRSKTLTTGDGWSVKPTKFGKLYLSLIFSKQVYPGMFRKELAAVAAEVEPAALQRMTGDAQ